MRDMLNAIHEHYEEKLEKVINDENEKHPYAKAIGYGFIEGAIEGAMEGLAIVGAMVLTVGVLGLINKK